MNSKHAHRQMDTSYQSTNCETSKGSASKKEQGFVTYLIRSEVPTDWCLCYGSDFRVVKYEGSYVSNAQFMTLINYNWHTQLLLVSTLAQTFTVGQKRVIGVFS